MNADLIILGAGPAGLTAGMYAARARIPLLLLEKAQTGGQMAATATVDNYPGFVDPVGGYELAQLMETQAKKFGLPIINTDITRVSKTVDGFTLAADSEENFSCKALIVATGASPVKLGIQGELELIGKGVSYCAVCDGPFFRDLEVAVIGGGDSAVEEAVYLTRFASRVHLVHRRDKLRACKEIQERAFSQPNIVFHWNSVPSNIMGDNEVQAVNLRSTVDGSEETVPVGGVFFYVGLKPNNEAFTGLFTSDQGGFIETDQKMACSLEGAFAAGDIRSKILRQITTAVGDGATAAYSAQHYLEST
jgi:thioredoxin reductase (NADPH)